MPLTAFDLNYLLTLFLFAQWTQQMVPLIFLSDDGPCNGLQLQPTTYYENLSLASIEDILPRLRQRIAMYVEIQLARTILTEQTAGSQEADTAHDDSGFTGRQTR